MAAARALARLSSLPSDLGMNEVFFATIAHFRTGGLVLIAELFSLFSSPIWESKL